jgi:hypothetical protein
MVLCRSSQRARLPIASRLDGQTAPERRCRMGLPAIRERPLAAGDRGWSSGTKGRVSGQCWGPSGPLLGIAQAAGCTSQVAISYCVRPMCPGEALTVISASLLGRMPKVRAYGKQVLLRARSRDCRLQRRWKGKLNAAFA